MLRNRNLRRYRSQFLLDSMECLEDRRLLAADPIIAEFQAVNVATIRDADGDASDWIEIENPDTATVNMSGWHLTDDKGDLKKWTFPDVSIPAGGRLLIYASNKDRRDPQQELHTNFRLASDGEYLALVKPDGVTVSQNFDPYPPQFEDQSYGLALQRDSNTLVPLDSHATALVPSDDSLGASWTQEGFDDSAWQAGRLSVGFEELRPAFSLRDTFDGPLDPAWIVDVPEGSTATVSLDNGALLMTTPRSNPTAPSDRGLAPFLRRDIPADTSPDWEVITRVTQGTSDRGMAGIGVYDLATGTIRLQLEYQGRSSFRLLADGENVGSIVKSSQSEYQLRLTRDSVSGSYSAYFRLADTDPWELVANTVEGDKLAPINSPQLALFARTTTSAINARFEDIEIVIPDQVPVYTPNISLPLAASMLGTNATAYIRVPFQVTGDPARYDELKLVTQFDDGFRAYLNGVEVSAQNVPVGATWNSTASGEFGAVMGRVPTREINLGAYRNLLHAGNNVLAIHGMNAAADNPDFYFSGTLIASDLVGVTEEFFTTPTPAKQNAIAAAMPPVVIGEQGLFFGTRAVELALQTDNPNWEIRYTLDGSIPTRFSTLYEGQFELTSTAMMQARVFDNTLGTRLEPSPITAATFVAADESLRDRSSNVPIIVVDTLGQALPASSATTLATANVVAFEVDPVTGRATLSSANLDYLGRGGVRDRGSSTAGQPKPNMAFETWGASGTSAEDDEDVGLLGFSSDSDWVLHAPYTYDRAMIRNQLAFGLTRSIGRNAPDTRAVEVYLNRRDGIVTESDYAGVYVLMEKIKLGKGRVDITPITPDATTEPDISGGYIWKIDRNDPNEPQFTAGSVALNWVEPKSPGSSAPLEDRATKAQQDWVIDYFNKFRDAARNPDITDPEGYSKYIDVGSWIDAHLMYVLGDNVDALNLSTYLYKDRGKKIEFGPQWDYDRSMESDDNRDDNPLLWGGSGGTAFFTSNFWSALFRDPGFWQAYVDRWTELRRAEFSDESIDKMIDKYANEIREAQAHNFTKWPGARPRRSSAYLSGQLDGTWQGEVEHLRTWIHARAAFMDSNFIVAPSLVSGDTEVPVGGVILDDGKSVAIEGPKAIVYTDEEYVTSENGVAMARFFTPTDDTLGTDWTALDFDDTSWVSGPLGVGSDTGSTFSDLIKTELDPPEGGTTILIRTEFNLTSSIGDRSLVLRARFDDGYVAYLNGVEVARRNLRDDTLTWNSRANTHANSDGVVFEDLDISEFRDTLVAGRNVLAIRVINASATSGDIFMQPALVARVTSFGYSPVGNLYYTLDGSDPRGPDGNPSAGARLAERGKPLEFAKNTRLMMRNFDEDTNLGTEARIVRTRWSAPASYTVIVNPASLAITEINYHPAPATDAEIAQGWSTDDFEFIEILNTSDVPADLFGVHLDGGATFDFASTPESAALNAGAYAVVVANRAAFVQRYGTNATILGEYTGRLDNAGERLSLVDEAGRVLFDVSYSDSELWGVAADGLGATLELRQPTSTPAETQSKWYAWRTSATFNGSPGGINVAGPAVVINEVAARAAADQLDAIELYNPSTVVVDLGGWYLSDSADNFKKYQIPNGTKLEPQQYLVIDQRQFNAETPLPGNVPFGLSGTNGDELWLTVGDGGAGIRQFVDIASFGSSRLGESWGRIGGIGAKLWPLASATLGQANSAVRAPGVLISEVNYHPILSAAAQSIGPLLDESDMEFIELHNPTGAEIDLSNWQLTGGVEFTIPQGVSLSPGQRLIVLKFNPAAAENAVRLSAFVANYRTDPNQVMLGGYRGVLSNSAEIITLWRAEKSDPAVMVWEDEVIYDDLTPWPIEADGLGTSLNRQAANSFGSDGNSWAGFPASPGGLPVVGSGDFDGSGTVDVTDINLLFAQLRSDQPDLRFDLDGDGAVNNHDRDLLITSILGTTFGDVDLDGRFDSNDLVRISQAGQYEDAVSGNSGWEQGDFDGDGDFTTRDIVLAFQRGSYVAIEAPAAIAAVERTFAEVQSTDLVSPANDTESVPNDAWNEGSDVSASRKPKKPLVS